MPALCLAWASLAATAQALQENPVYVDDSPQARELFQRAEDQAGENLAEAARSIQELLDDYALRLIPSASTRAEALHSFATVRRRVLDLLRDPENTALLNRYRSLEQPRAQRLLDAGRARDIERLVLTRSLTEPGLEAMLILAQAHLEHARFRSAIDRLVEAVDHPDITTDSRRAAHTWFMLGMANHYEGDAAAVETAIHELAMLGESHELLLDRLLQLQDAPTPRGATIGVSTFDRGRAGDLSGLVAEEIWSVELTEAPLARQAAMPGRRGPVPGFRTPAQGSAQAADEDGRLATMIPTVAELSGPAHVHGGPAGAGVVYINQGHTITALDRFTGNRIWERDYVDRATLLLVDRTGEPVMDPNVVAVRGDALVTITGHAHGSSRSSDGRVVCLDARTGDLRWAVRFDRLEIGGQAQQALPREAPFWAEEVEGLFPHGRPLILDDLVLVKARRISPQALTSAYLVALDLETGDARWVRHIASSGSIRRSARALAAMVAHTDAIGSPLSDAGPEPTAVYIVTAVGAVASVNPRTGEINWLHRFSVPLQPLPQDINLRPWEVATPHLTRDRVLAIHPGRRQVAVYDRATGELLERHEATSRETWNAPAYLLGDEQWVYAVTSGGSGGGGGRDIRAFRLDDLTRPAWRFPRDTFHIRGRVQLADVGLIVPSAEGVVILDRESGEVLVHLPTEHGRSELAGNAVAFDSQVIVATDRSVSAYMSLDRAEQMLRDRIAAAPLDPEPALSLGRLALRASNLELALEAGEMALSAIDAGPPPGAAPARAATPRDRLVTLLLELDAHDVAQSPDEIESLFSLIDRAAVSPEQRLAHVLAYGDRLAEIDPARAVNCWQGVLSDPILAHVARIEDHMERRGRDWAESRLAAAIAQHGAAVYEPHAAAARNRLVDLKRGESSPDDLVALAQEFPHTDAADDALLAASRLLAEAGEHQRALAVLRAHDQPGRDQHARERLLDAYMSLAGELGLDMRVRSAIQLRSGPPPAPLPLVGTPAGPAQVLSGRVLAPPADSENPPPTDRLLLLDGTQLTMLGAADASAGALTTLWTADMEAQATYYSIVHWSERDLLIGVGDSDDPRILALDPANGEVRWRTRRFLDIFGTVRAGAMRMTPTGERIDPSAVLAVSDDQTLILVQRSGRIAGFDIRAGGQPLWRSGPQANAADTGHPAPVVSNPSLDEIHSVRLRGGLLALSGGARRSSGRSAAAVAVHDARTGASVLERIVRLDADPLWIELSASGRILYGGAEGIGCIDIWRGERAWVNVAPEAVDAKRAWLGAANAGHERVYFEDSNADLRVVDARSGSMTDPFDAPRDATAPQPQLPPQFRPAPGPNEFLALMPVESGEALAHFRQRIIRYSGDGEVIGTDVLGGERNFTWLLRGRPWESEAASPPAQRDRRDEDRLILINALPPIQGVIPGSPVGARRTQHRHLVYVLSGNARLVAEPVELPPLPEPIRMAMLIDGWLIVSLSQRTIAVPMP